MEKYVKISEEYIDEIHSKVTVYQHKKTLARVCCISNDDKNKVFCIAFRTPAINSTGLTHILEHSVLCGSKKYPVKDPFLELIKGSLNTFLNAFTYPDKTCYPCASQNDKDFKNLMSVYMDAVFYPNIYSKEEIFRQEGWRYEIFDKKDPICYNGVVYNEMKGAFSSPDDVLGRNVMHSLFPDTSYQYESGGDPKEIPSLSYEQFKNFHKKYYSPTNSYIYLYGNMDMEERLDWMDREYLSRFDKVEFDTKVKFQKPFHSMKEEKVFYPIGEDEGEDKKTQYALSYVLKDNKDIELNVAMGVLNSVLVSDPGSPLKKAVLDTKLAESVDASFDEGLNQPYTSYVFKGTNPEDKDKLVSAINSVFTKSIEGGLDHEAILSHINFLEFKVREAKFSSMPRGLDLILSSLSYSLYDDKAFTKDFKVFPVFPKLREDLKNGYFEEVIKKYLLENTHSSLIELAPSKTVQEENDKEVKDKLAKFKASLSEEQIDELIKKSNDLRAYQAAPSTKEEIATLPHLKQEDLTDEPSDFKSELSKGTYDTYFQEHNTNGINYCNYLFDLTDLPNKYIPYVSLLSTVYKRIKTEKRSENALNSVLMNKVGNLSFTYNDYQNKERNTKCLFSLGYSALDVNMEDVEDLVEEIVHTTVFDDTSTLYQVLAEIKASASSEFAYMGHIIAYKRALSHFNEDGYFKDMVSGIGYFDFICDLVDHFDAKKDEIVSMLKETRDIVFSKARFFNSYTGSKQGLELEKKNADKFYSSMKKDVKPEGKFVFVPDMKNEGIKAPYDVLFNARVGNYIQAGGKYSGAIYTLGNLVDNDYLWMKVRVKGGAYGCFSLAHRDGTIGWVSYRDPNLEATDEVYKNLPEFVSNLNYASEDILKCKIGALSSFNPVLHVADQGTLGFMRKYLHFNYEDICKEQKELLSADLNTLKSYAPCLKSTIDHSVFASFGNAKVIEENKAKFDVVRDLIKA